MKREYRDREYIHMVVGTKGRRLMNEVIESVEGYARTANLVLENVSVAVVLKDSEINFELRWVHEGVANKVVEKVLKDLSIGFVSWALSVR